MTTYVAFLRAINVGGRFVKMEALRALFNELGYANVRTHIQSGNVFFESPKKNRKTLTNEIEAQLLASLGYEVTTFLRTIPELEYAMSLDPFKRVAVTSDTRLCVVFLSEPIPEGLKLPLSSPKQDIQVLSATDGEAFVVLHSLPGKAPNANAFLEKTLKSRTTTRFFGTTQKILDAAKTIT